VPDRQPALAHWNYMVLGKLNTPRLLPTAECAPSSEVQHRIFPILEGIPILLAGAMLCIVQELGHTLLADLPTDIVTFLAIGSVPRRPIFELTILRELS